MLYVLDEPSIGLHQRDNARLLDTLRRLRDLGNTVIVVEHDEDAIRAADYVVDIGPGAGVHGGEIVAEGTPRRDRRQPEFADRPLPLRRADGARSRRSAARRRRASELTIVGARGNNLKNVTVDDPARPLHLRHRRLGRRQVDPRHRHALQGRGARAEQRERPAGAARAHRGPERDRQGDRHRPVADRPHAALEPGHLHRRLHARSATGSPACRRPRRAATGRAASRSTSRAGAARPARATA